MRYNARESWHRVAFPPAPRTISTCRAGIVGRLVGSFRADFWLRRPMVVVIWRDDHAPPERNGQATEHAGLASNRRYRVIRQRRTERQKHACPLPQPTRAFARCGESNSRPPAHIVSQPEDSMQKLPNLLSSSTSSTVRGPFARFRDDRRRAPSSAWTTPSARRRFGALRDGS
jgi:hypothetical protein